MRSVRYFVFLSMLLIAAKVHAFSVGPGFFILSNYELVKQSEAIVVAKVKWKMVPSSQVKLRVTESLKGNFKKRDKIEALGITEKGGKRRYGEEFKFQGRSKRGDFSRARPGTYRGSGTAYDYRIGQYYLLILSGRGVGEPALSRTQEEIDPDDSPWMVAVKHYIEIAKLKDYDKEKSALKKLRAKAMAGADPINYPVGLVADIDKHFSTPSPMKSYSDIMTLYESAKTKREKEKVLYAIAKAGHKEALPLVRELIVDPETCNIFLGYLVKVKDSNSVETVADNFVSIEWRNERWARTLVSLADERHTDLMLRCLEASKEEEATQTILSWFGSPPSAIVQPALRKAVAQEYEEQWYPALCLAELGDEDVVRWAIQKLKGAEGESLIRATITLTGSPTETANIAIERVISEGDEDTLIHVLRGLIADRHCGYNPRRWKHLETLVSLENKSDRLVSEMRTSLENRSGNRAQSLLKILNAKNRPKP